MRLMHPVDLSAFSRLRCRTDQPRILNLTQRRPSCCVAYSGEHASSEPLPDRLLVRRVNSAGRDWCVERHSHEGIRQRKRCAPTASYKRPFSTKRRWAYRWPAPAGWTESPPPTRQTPHSRCRLLLGSGSGWPARRNSAAPSRRGSLAAQLRPCCDATSLSSLCNSNIL